MNGARGSVVSPMTKIRGRIRTLRETSGMIMEAMERSPAFSIWVGFLTIVIFMAAYSLLMSLIFTMEILEFYTNIPWVLMVSNYVFLVGSSVGLCFVSSMGYVFGLKRFQMVGKRGVFLALVMIIFGLTSILLHLGHPERGPIYMNLTPNIRSAMWYMNTLYPPYILFIALWYFLLARRTMAGWAAESDGIRAKVYGLMALEGIKEKIGGRVPLEKLEEKIEKIIPLRKLGLALDSENAEFNWARVFATLALLFALLAYAVEGSLFAHVEARPFWHGPLYAIDFFLGASLCGVAWLLALGIITYRLRGEEIPPRLRNLYLEMAEILALLLSLLLLFTAYKMGHGLFEPAKAKVIALYLKGSFSLSFWLFEIAIGIVVPLFLLVFSAARGNMNGIFVSSVMVLVGYFVKRYDFVVASQAYPLIKRNTLLESYAPTSLEILLISGIIAAVLLIYTLGVKFLPLKEDA